MTNYIDRLKAKLKIKKFDPDQPINAWLFVLILNIVGFAGYFYLKINDIHLGDWLFYLISFLIDLQKFLYLSILVKSGKVQINSLSNKGSFHSLNSSLIESLFNLESYFVLFFKSVLITLMFAFIYSLIINIWLF